METALAMSRRTFAISEDVIDGCLSLGVISYVFAVREFGTMLMQEHISARAIAEITCNRVILPND